jgi:VanZ family protein
MTVSRCNAVGARLMLGIALMIASYGMLTPHPPVRLGIEQGDKILHLATFFGLALLADLGWPRRGFVPAKYLPLLAFGIAIECIQYYIPGRSFSLGDILADGAGLALYGLLALPGLRWARIR